MFELIDHSENTTTHLRERTIKKSYIRKFTLCVFVLFLCIVVGMIAIILFAIAGHIDNSATECNVDHIFNNISCIEECIGCRSRDRECIKVFYNITWDPNCEFQSTEIYPSESVQYWINNFVDHLDCAYSSIDNRCFNPTREIVVGATRVRRSDREDFVDSLIIPGVSLILVSIFSMIASSIIIYFYILKIYSYKHN